VQVKNAKKHSEKLPLSSKPGKILRQDPVTYISETGKGTEYVLFFFFESCSMCYVLSFSFLSECMSFTLNCISVDFLLC
jgi:hypothetical protein